MIILVRILVSIFFDNGLCIPSDTKLTDSQLDEIIKIIRGLW